MDEHGILNARVRPGHDATVLDVSVDGALIETAHRLLPGSCVELQIVSQDRRVSIKGRVLRCAVARLRASGVWYRGAIAFEHSLPWFAEPAGYQVHGSQLGTNRRGRGPTTPDVI
jgi:hypothetical protein